jgi:hypothetical protein
MSQMEVWKKLNDFEDYAVSTEGRVRRVGTHRILTPTENQQGILQVGLMRDGVQHKRSLALLVAIAHIPQLNGVFDTPIHLNWDKMDARAENLAWRPRWFARDYHAQIMMLSRYPILNSPIKEKKTRGEYRNSRDCAKQNGLLETDLIASIANKTYVFPTYQKFEVIAD